MICWSQLQRGGLQGIQEIQGPRDLINADHLCDLEFLLFGCLGIEKAALDFKEFRECLGLLGGGKSLQIAYSEGVQQAFIAGDLINCDEVSVQRQETTEISHVDITLVTILMTVRV